MDQEKLRILKLIEEGKISANEGARLIEALESGEPKTGSQDSFNTGQAGTKIRIRVSDTRNGNVKVNLTIPIGIAHMIRSFIPQPEIEKLENQGINISQIFDMASAGKIGKIIDIDDQEHCHRVEVCME